MGHNANNLQRAFGESKILPSASRFHGDYTKIRIVTGIDTSFSSVKLFGLPEA